MNTTDNVAAHLRIPIIIGVTGHRDLREEDRRVSQEGVRKIFDEIKDLYPHSLITLLSPLAEGADRLVARVALNLGVKLVVPLPMPIEEYKKDFKSPESVNEFDELLGLAEQLFELPPMEEKVFEKNGELVTDRERKYEQVGAYIARHSQILIALWDGVRTGLSAGTSKIVDFKLKGIPEPYAPFRSHLDPVENGPVYHIVTRRVSNPHPEGEPFSLIRLYPQSHGHNEQVASTYEGILKKIDSYNRDITLYASRLSERIQESQSGLIPSDSVEHLREETRHIWERYAVSDTLAMYFQRKSRRTLIGLLLLGLAGILFFHIYIEILTHPFVLLFYPVTLGLAFSWYSISKRRNYQNKHLDYRAVAEGLRVQLFWNLAGLKDDAADHYLRKQKSELEWIRHAIRVYNIQESKVSDPDSSHRTDEDSLSYYRVILNSWINSERNYYTRATERDKRKLEIQEKLVGLFYWLGLSLAIVLLVFHNYLRSLELIHEIIVVSIAMSLAIAAAIHGHKEKLAVAEHVKQYNRMSHLFTHASNRLELFLNNNELHDAQHLIREIGIEALRENGDWVLLHRSRPIEVPKG